LQPAVTAPWLQEVQPGEFPALREQQLMAAMFLRIFLALAAQLRRSTRAAILAFQQNRVMKLKERRLPWPVLQAAYPLLVVVVVALAQRNHSLNNKPHRLQSL